MFGLFVLILEEVVEFYVKVVYDLVVCCGVKMFLCD